MMFAVSVSNHFHPDFYILRADFAPFSTSHYNSFLYEFPSFTNDKSEEITLLVADKKITAIASLGEEIATQEYPVGTLESEVIGTFQTTLEVTTSEIKTIPVTWITNNTFAEKTADAYTLTDDTYIYTVKLDGGYTLDTDVSLPTITVTMVEVPQHTVPITGTGWTLTDGTLTIGTNEGMTAWVVHAPHGDGAIYETMVRLSRGHGAWSYRKSSESYRLTPYKSCSIFNKNQYRIFLFYYMRYELVNQHSFN